MRSLTILMILLTLLSGAACIAATEDHAAVRERAQQDYRDGNYRDAFELYRRLCLELENDRKQIGTDLYWAWQCLRQLNRLDELDRFRERVIGAHSQNWRLLMAAARSYADNQHWGYMIAGEFERGGHRGGGKYVNAVLRDRTRALQLMRQAMGFAEADPAENEVARFYLEFGRILNQFRGRSQSWRLHALTDLSRLPDYEPGYGYEYEGSPAGAAVDENGRPVFHDLPQSWASAATDGERWRWVNQRAVELDPGLRGRVLYDYAAFLLQQFGVQTMAEYGSFFGWGRPVAEDRSETPEAGAYAVHTLKDTETIAKIAVGVRRFSLPADHNHIRLFETVAGLPNSGYADEAVSRLAQIYENRRQYGRAADYWKKYARYNRAIARERISQILDNWGRFEAAGPQPARVLPTVEYRFRNGEQVFFEAYRIRVPRLLEDIKNYIRSRPRRLEWRRLDPNNIGWRLVHENQSRYLGAKVAAWTLELEPDRRHWDRRVTVKLPEALEQAGAYLLVASMQAGNTARIIVWTSDTAIAKKPVRDTGLYYVADAVTGEPLAGMPVEFFGYRTRSVSGTNRHRIDHLTFSRRTDMDGLILMAPEQMPQDYQWLVTAGDGSGRLAFLGFSNVWYPRHHDRTYHQTKTFVMTDRPVYRPGQLVNFKMWVREAKYDRQDSSVFAGRRFQVRIHDPGNDEVYSKTLTADEYGGLSGGFELAADAPLGVYRISHTGGGVFGGQSFRVEEYKKPEFEVKIEAPREPVMLGEKIEAIVRADYYFGAPVSSASVRYKVLRNAHDSRWYPEHYWDWLYGPGYWWYGYDYPWYPQWEKWGCRQPARQWWPQARREQPELVAEGEVPIQKDGTVRIAIDTSLAKLIHGDSDHRYTIQAEVRDMSRRTIAAAGQVLVARRPFKVYAWVDRGHYRVGDTVRASFKAQTLDRQPVVGKGRLKLLRIAYRDDRPVESQVGAWDLNTDGRGQARFKLQAARAGQYRLSYTVTDARGHRIEGGYIFNVRGAGGDSAGFRFAKLELIPDRAEYADGDTVRLMVNTDRAGAAVLLFLRPSDGVYLPPKVLKPRGKSTIEQVVVDKKDMPNFFVEALTIYDGKVHSEVREIAVPPEKRVLNVAVTPSRTEYLPGQKAGLKLALSDLSGEPFAGEAVVSVYDRALEYISAGSNVPEIRAFFWKWRRHHHPQLQSSLARRFDNLLKKDETPMRGIGVFGEVLPEADEESEADERGEGDGQVAGALRSKAMEAPSPSAPSEMQAGKKEASLDVAEPEAEPPAAASDANSGQVRPAVRTEFADTAFWTDRIITDAEGEAEVSFDMPENLTSWKVVVWAMGRGTKVGQQIVEVVTRKNLILRLQAPRFFVETDEVVLSANVHNYLETAKEVRVGLELEGDCLELMPLQAGQKIVRVTPDGEARVDWRVKVKKEGETVVRMLATTGDESDAMQMRFPVLVHGMMKQVPRSGVIRPGQSAASVEFRVPAERRVAQSRLELRYSPTLAGAMVDALPYLADYPYGCTEQTLNRFLPTVITRRTLQRMGLSLSDIRDKRVNLNARQIGDDRQRADQWQRYGQNPVFDDARVADMVAAGIKRLAAMQLSDGGWGWFSGYGEKSYPHTTALVVHGMQIARASDVAVPEVVISEGLKWLKNYQQVQLDRLERWDREKKSGKSHADNLDAFVYMVLVDEGTDLPAMREDLYRDRNHLAVYAKAMFAMALHRLQDTAKFDMLKRNIEQYLVEDDENQTAYLELPNSGYWWHWYGSEYEAQAYYLKLLALTEPGSRKASRLVKYLLNNRRHATYWNSTRDTAVIVEAFADYISASGEDDPDVTVEILYDGRPMKKVKIDKTNLFAFDNRLVVTGADITTGDHTLEIRKSGRGSVYFNAYLDYFTLEDRIEEEGLEIKVQRRIFRLEAVEKAVKTSDGRGRAVDKRVEGFERELLENMDAVQSGDLVEVELLIESKNDYEYLVFEDMKAAGFEPVEVRSGYTGNEMGAYVEFRDRKVCFFVQQLARGRHSVTYRLRAEIPGKFSAMPTRGYAMYAPELKANSDEIKLTVRD